jgi:hypothetical protein
MTGEELHTLLEQAARKSGLSLNEFVAPLAGKNTSTWLKQLRIATEPRKHTVERITALLEGRAVPPPPPNNFQKSPPRPRLFSGERYVHPVNPPEPQDRDPCFLCGTRSDIGCRHQR